MAGAEVSPEERLEDVRGGGRGRHPGTVKSTEGTPGGAVI